MIEDGGESTTKAHLSAQNFAQKLENFSIFQSFVFSSFSLRRSRLVSISFPSPPPTHQTRLKNDDFSHSKLWLLCVVLKIYEYFSHQFSHFHFSLSLILLLLLFLIIPFQHFSFPLCRCCCSTSAPPNHP